MTQERIIKAITESMNAYGREATLKALNAMYHAGQITIEQVMKALDIINK